VRTAGALSPESSPRSLRQWVVRTGFSDRRSLVEYVSVKAAVAPLQFVGGALTLESQPRRHAASVGVSGAWPLS
jgi:hypothetical protein